jgi:nucleoside-diphosphate-sugar epimerase
VLIVLGCGDLGARVRALWSAPSLGVRRQGGAGVVAGDLADPSLYDRLPADPAEVLIAATPGLRRGRDHGLVAGVALAAERFPGARLVLTSTTAVYADAAGGDVDEDAAVSADDPAVAGLLAIERAAAAHARALILRLTAITGPGRDRVRRLVAGAGAALAIGGDPERPFSWVHADDAAAVCVQALTGALGTGLLNVAAPERMSWADYYRLHAEGRDLRIISDGSAAPRRRIAADRLHRLLPGMRWRGPTQAGPGQAGGRADTGAP